jgi:hypothetical protein
VGDARILEINMRLKILATAATSIFALWSSSAQASSDYSCRPTWALSGYSEGSITSAPECGDRAFISPSNDTRSNMMLFLQDRQPKLERFRYSKETFVSDYGNNYFTWNLLLNNFAGNEQDYDITYPKNSVRYLGSRCSSLDAGSSAFDAAMLANKDITPDERKILNLARQYMTPVCETLESKNNPYRYIADGEEDKAAQGEQAVDEDALESEAAKLFMRYIKGASFFYSGEYEASKSIFSDLAQSKDDWIKETSLYMLARVDLNASQVKSFGEYGEFLGVQSSDAAAVSNANTALQNYIKAYPKGRYIQSATGLLRRAYWLNADYVKLTDIYNAMLSERSGSLASLTPLINEIDSKLLFQVDAIDKVTDPIVLAVIDLARIREYSSSSMYNNEYNQVPDLTKEALEAQKPKFANEPELYGFLEASLAFYKEKNPKRVLELIPDAAKQENFSYLQFSRQALRGMALNQLKDVNEGGFWRDMISGSKSAFQRPFAELGLALYLERKGQITQIVADDSPIKELFIREIILQNIASPELLTSIATNKTRPQHERDVALFTLLYKQLSRGYYKGFLDSQNLIAANAKNSEYIPDFQSSNEIPVGVFKSSKQGELSCPSLRQTVQALAVNSSNDRGKLCVGEFMRLNGFDDFTFLESFNAENAQVIDGAKAKGRRLGYGATQFPGAYIARSTLYKDVLANPKANADDKAYALYRLVNCYAPSGYNGCRGKDEEKAQRKNWYNDLKINYPNSAWAKKQRYYW